MVALAGNPNAGKTTLYNVLTGSRAHVGNYPGVTVDRRVGEASFDGVGQTDVLDIPGTYSLVARTGEEQIAIDAMLGLGGQPRPQAIVLCVDATQFVRGTHIALQALEFGLPVVVALTMVDEAKDAAPDAAAMARQLGCEVIPVVAAQGRGVDELRAAIARRIRDDRREEIWHWEPSPWLRERLAKVRAVLPAGWPNCDAMALWALMSVEAGDELRGIPEGLRQAVTLDNAADHKRLDDEAICGRYAWMDRHLAPLGRREPDRSRTDRLDRILLHPWLGMLIFLLLMFLLFQGLFSGAEPLVHLIERVFATLGDLIKSALPGQLAHFLADGLLAGVGAVLVFLPQILLLFFLLGILEDSGYMARVAYLMDRPMRTMHLHGRAFVPMLSGFACAVPAILATRTMERRRDRLLTMLTIPLTTCSARLPVYTLIIASLFPSHRIAGFLPTQGLLVVGMYGFGILAALLAALVLGHALPPLRSRRLPLVLELPPYRMPRLRDVSGMMWQRARRFLTDAGTVIVIGSMILWGLLNFPAQPAHPSRNWAQEIAAAPVAARAGLQAQFDAERVQQSYAGRLGHAMEPVLAPLGFDWKIGIGLVGAFAAREVFVATMGVVYGSGESQGQEGGSLRDKLHQERRADGHPLYTPLVGVTLLLFFALACQCTSTLAAIHRETASWRWPAFLFLYTGALAWLVSFAVYQIGRSLGLG